MIAKRIATFVAHDGIHHRKTCAESAHQTLDKHEPGNNPCNGGSLDVNGKRGLVTYAGLVFLLLEKDDSDDKVKEASDDKVGFAFGNVRVQKCSESDKKSQPGNDGGDYRDFCFVMEDADDVYVQHAHKARDCVFGAHREANGDVGKAAGDGNGGGDGFELRILQVCAQSPECRDHKDEQPVIA